ncbi:tail protein (tape measure) [Kluyvera ascorbata]
MAGEKDAGSIVYTVSADIEPLLIGGKLAADALDKLDSAAKSSSKGMDNLDQSASQTGSAFTELAGYANSIDNQLRKLNTNVSGVARAMEEARSGTGGANSEFNRAESIIEALGNQLAVLDEAQENGARSAAVLAAQLRAGSKATDEEKQKIGELTNRLYDMKTGVENGAKGNGKWKSSMQAAGYQVQDFIIQVQGGQSALVAFAQQGSQLAGAFGPGGAVVGAVIALSSVIAGVLITSLNGGKNAMDALKDATEAMDKVITISQNGVAALSDKYANLARVNAEAATILRNQAMIEYNAAISKIPKSINDASNSIVGFTDKLKTSFIGGIASIDEFNKNLSTVGATAESYSAAMEQARNAGARFTVNANAIQNTVATLAEKFGVSEQRAFELSKQLSEVASNPTPAALQKLVLELQSTESSTKSGTEAIRTFLGPLTELVRVASEAQINLSGMKKEVDNLTAGQKNLMKQYERNLALSKLQGEARARLQAQYAAEDAGFAKDDPHAKQMGDDAASTYRNTQAQKTLQTTQKKGVTQAESIAQKLANLKQQSELAADSTNKLSREQAILTAQQSLGKGASQEQIKLAGEYRAKAWDAAAAAKGVAETLKAIPEEAENKSYSESIDNLKAALSAGKIDQKEYYSATEKLALEHKNNLAKINAQAVVNPVASARAEVDPVQQLANQNNQKLALMQQYQQQEQAVLLQSYKNGQMSYTQYVAAKQETDSQYLALRNAQETEYEQQRIAAQWEIYRNQSQANELLAASVDGFQSGATNAITGLINSTQSLQEAFANIGTTILGSVVGALIEMGMQWAKSQLMGQAAAAASLASTMAQATAAASAWAPAAISASIATMGSAAAVGQSAYAGSLLSAKGMAIAGARYNGGPVSANSMYQVGENGKPEIYQASNGSQYMIPGDNGRVISNRDMQGGGSGGAVIQQEVHFHIETTGGIDDATMAKMSQMMKQVSLNTIRDQQRPNGLLRR